MVVVRTGLPPQISLEIPPDWMHQSVRKCSLDLSKPSSSTRFALSSDRRPFARKRYPCPQIALLLSDPIHICELIV